MLDKYEQDKFLYIIVYENPFNLKNEVVFVKQDYVLKLKKPLKEGQEIEVIKNGKRNELKYIYY